MADKAKDTDERYREDTWRGEPLFRCTTCSTTRSSLEAILDHVVGHVTPEPEPDDETAKPEGDGGDEG